MSRIKPIAFLTIATATLIVFAGLAFSQTSNTLIDVKNAWVRSTVPGQMGTGAFMNITAREGSRLIGVSSPVAGISEVHEMKMENDVMKMRQVSGIDLPAGVAVELSPGRYHIMLMDLKQPVLPNSVVPLTLRFKDAKGAESKLELNLTAGTRPPATGHHPAGKAHSGTGHKH